MPSESKAFAPGNISCIFKIYYNKNPRWMGSYGLGFTLNEGVIVAVRKSDKTMVSFNNKKINMPTVKEVANRLTNEKLDLQIKTKLPLGYGFGLSGASALAASYAINNLLKLKKTSKELAIIAHTAEVRNKTGLGDVVNQYYGGFFAKLQPSSYFVVKKIPINKSIVYCMYFSKIETKAVITNTKLKNRINKAASIALTKVERLLNGNKAVNLRDIIEISKEFSTYSGLLKDKKTLQTINNIEKNSGKATMIMLGNALFSDAPFDGAKKFCISNKGAYLL